MSIIVTFIMQEDYKHEIDQFRQWLGSFERQRLDNWDRLLKANPESALCEAMTYHSLIENGCSVEPFQDLSTGGVDFKCYQGDKVFYVEVTCISREKVTKESGLSHMPQGGCYYSPLTKTFWNEISQKVPQCSGLDAPCLIAIGTFHFQGGSVCFNDSKAEEILTGKSYVAMMFDTRIGQVVGQPYSETELESAVFIRPTKQQKGGIEYARSPISGVLLCAYSGVPSRIVGVLHPNPNHLFERELLPKIKFGKLKDGYKKNGILDVEWI